MHSLELIMRPHNVLLVKKRSLPLQLLKFLHSNHQTVHNRREPCVTYKTYRYIPIDQQPALEYRTGSDSTGQT